MPVDRSCLSSVPMNGGYVLPLMATRISTCSSLVGYESACWLEQPHYRESQDRFGSIYLGGYFAKSTIIIPKELLHDISPCKTSFKNL